MNKIRNYLINKGINEKYITDSISKMNIEESDQDFFSAIKTCKKKELDQIGKKTIVFFFIKKTCQF